MEWEHVTTDTLRLKVPGGWLYMVRGAGGGIAFVPEPPATYIVNTSVVVHPGGDRG